MMNEWMNEWMNELINWPSSLGRYGWVLQSKCAFWTAISGSACKTFKFWKIFDFDKNPRDDLGKGGWHGVVRFDQQTCIFNSSQWVCILTTWILKDLWLTKIERMSWAREAYKGVVHFKQQTCIFNSNQWVCMFVSRGTCLSICLWKRKTNKEIPVFICPWTWPNFIPPLSTFFSWQMKTKLASILTKIKKSS